MKLKNLLDMVLIGSPVFAIWNEDMRDYVSIEWSKYEEAWCDVYEDFKLTDEELDERTVVEISGKSYGQVLIRLR